MFQLLQAQSKTPLDAQYLDRLKELPPNLLAAEHDLLSTASKTVSAALSQVGTADAAQFASLSTTLASINRSFEELSSSAADASDNSQKVPSQPVQPYQQIQQLVDRELELYIHLDRVQDLIEIPSLVKTCIDSGMYASALDLAAFSSRMANRHPKSTIVANINQQIKDEQIRMRDILVKLLKETSKLQVIIKVTTILRKLEPFKSENPIAVENLLSKCRFIYLNSQLDLLQPLAASSSTAYIRKYIDTFRDIVGTTIPAINTVFGESNNTSARFARQAVQNLTKELNTHLPKIDEDRSRVFLQLTYCSYSLSRLGIEFWPLLESDLDEDEWANAYKVQQDLSNTAVK